MRQFKTQKVIEQMNLWIIRINQIAAHTEDVLLLRNVSRKGFSVINGAKRRILDILT